MESWVWVVQFFVQHSNIPFFHFFIPLRAPRSLRLCFLELFSKSSRRKKQRNTLRPGGASRTWRDSIGGNNLDLGMVAWVPRGTYPRSPYEKPNPFSDPANKIMIRRQPRKEPPPHDVPPCTGCAPGAPPESSLPWHRACRAVRNRLKLLTRLGGKHLFFSFGHGFDLGG